MSNSVLAVNSPPVINTPSSITIQEDTPLHLEISDADGDILCFSFRSNTKGDVQGYKVVTFKYITFSNENGTDSFIITVTDGTDST